MKFYHQGATISSGLKTANNGTCYSKPPGGRISNSILFQNLVHSNGIYCKFRSFGGLEVWFFSQNLFLRISRFIRYYIKLWRRWATSNHAPKWQYLTFFLCTWHKEWESGRKICTFWLLSHHYIALKHPRNVVCIYFMCLMWY